MTDHEDRSKDLKICETRIFSRESKDPLLLSKCLKSSISNETYNLVIPNTDSEGDYETSSEGPQSPKSEFNPSTKKNLVEDNLDGNIIPEMINTVLLKREEKVVGNDSRKDKDSNENSESPRKIDCKENFSLSSTNSCSKIIQQSFMNGLDEFEAPRTEYYVTHRVESEANKSESLPIIKIATPWGSYEYPDVRMPAERLVSDSQVDIKEKMRVIAACMDGSSLLESRTKFLDKIYNDQDRNNELSTKLHESECTEVKHGGFMFGFSRPVTPRTPKLITVTSPKICSEPFNVLPIIRNPELEYDSMFLPSPSASGSDFPMNCGFYNRDIPEFPTRNFSIKKSNYDPLSLIEGELAPLQNELSEIRGKVRALNLDFNLSNIHGINKYPKSKKSMVAESKNYECNLEDRIIKPFGDDFIPRNFHFPSMNENVNLFHHEKSIKASNFNREIISEKISINHSEIFDSKNCEEKNSAEMKIGEIKSREKLKNSEVIKPPDCSDKISIVPISYTGGIPDPPAEPVFNFAKEEDCLKDNNFDHKILKIENLDFDNRDKIIAENSLSYFSDTQFTLDYNETEGSLSIEKDYEAVDSSNENSPRSYNRIIIAKKFVRKTSCDNYSSSNEENKERSTIRKRKTYIRGMICGPEDFL